MEDQTRQKLRDVLLSEIEAPQDGLAEKVLAALPLAAPAPAGLLVWIKAHVAWVVGGSGAIGGGILALVLIMNQAPEVAVYAGYADTTERQSAAFPSPWAGAADVIFRGSEAPYDAGAIRIENRSSRDVTVEKVTVDVGDSHYAIWPGGIRLAPRTSLILTQTVLTSRDPVNTDFDTSEANGQTCQPASAAIPVVRVTVDGVTHSYQDRQRVLNTGGVDLGSCAGTPSESHQWEDLGRPAE